MWQGVVVAAAMWVERQLTMLYEEVERGQGTGRR